MATAVLAGFCTESPAPAGAVGPAPYRGGATAIQRMAQRSAPAVTAAVSTRSTPSPRPTRFSARASSRGDQPPSGPMSTPGTESETGAPPGSARATADAVREETISSTVQLAQSSGRKGRRDCMADSRTILRSRSPRRLAACRSGRTIVRSATRGVNTSTPSSTSLATAHSVRSALAQENPTSISGRRRSMLCTGPVTSRPPLDLSPRAVLTRVDPPVKAHNLHEPAPSAAPTVSPGFSRNTSPKW